MMSLVGYEASSSEDEAEDISLKTKATTVDKEGKVIKSSKDNAANITTSGANKGGIKITAPAIPDMDSDDEEDFKSGTNKPKNNADAPRSGLLAKLPAPTKSKATGAANTRLLPYVFTKPKAENLPAKNASAQNSAEVQDSDQTSQNTPSCVPSIVQLRKRSALAAARLISEKRTRYNEEADSDEVQDSDQTSQNTPSCVPSIAQLRKRSALAAARLISEKRTKYTEEDDSDEEPSVTGFFSYVEDIPPDEISNVIGFESVVSANPAPDVPDTWSHGNSTRSAVCVESVPTEIQPSIDPGYSAEMQRLQGKGNRKEKVNFIDIHADDALEGSKEMLLKQISEEKNIERTSHKKTNVPGGIMKRKHQLPYLVQQAKARELELKNAWAQNRATKQQTQSKYGW